MGEDEEKKRMEDRLDNIIGDDARKGYRIKTLPPEVHAALAEVREAEPALNLPDITRVRFTKLTPKKRRLVNEQVIARYHVDLQAKHPDGSRKYLSNAELKKLNVERGEWSDEQDKRIQWLTEETNRLMKQLYGAGMDKRNEWGRDIVQKANEIRSLFQAGLNEAGEPVGSPGDYVDALDRFERWLEYGPDQKEYYTLMYAESQGRTSYSADSDWTFITNHAPHTKIIDLMTDVEELKTKLRRYVECLRLRSELMELQVRQGKMFAESVEQRRDTTDEMARLFFCTERVDDADKPLGTLTKTFDGMWELPDEVINWLLLEIYFFFQGTPDVEGARGFLEEWGFIVAPPKTTPESSTPPSGESLAEPTSNTESNPSGETSADSTE